MTHFRPSKTIATFWRRAQARRAEAGDLAVMSDAELADMSIGRTDVSRLFEPAFAPEFRSRGAGPRMQPR